MKYTINSVLLDRYKFEATGDSLIDLLLDCIIFDGGKIYHLDDLKPEVRLAVYKEIEKYL